MLRSARGVTSIPPEVKLNNAGNYGGLAETPRRATGVRREGSKLNLLFDQKPLLHLLLTLDTVRCPGNCVEPLDLNIVAAVYALAVRALCYSIERLFNQPECISLIRALREEKFLRV